MITQSALGFTFNPVKIAKKAGSAIAHPVRSAKKVGSAVIHPIRTVKAAGREAADAAKQVGHAVKVGVIKPAEWLANKATAPIRNRVHTLRNRRAAKLAFDRRKSKTPNAQEQAEAKSWTQKKLKGQGPHGHLLALFAGPADGMFGYYDEPYSGQLGVEPATMTLIAASIPVFMALMNKVLGSADKSGEAPANPAADAAAAASAPPGAGGDPGAVDLTPVQDAASAATAAMEDVAAGGDGSGSAMVRVPGVGSVKRSHLMLGGGILAAILVLGLLTKRKD